MRRGERGDRRGAQPEDTLSAPILSDLTWVALILGGPHNGRLKGSNFYEILEILQKLPLCLMNFALKFSIKEMQLSSMGSGTQ